MRPVFHPIEAAIVRIALGDDSDVQQFDLWRPARGVVTLHPDGSGGRNLQLAACNSLARMILSGYEEALPTYRWSAGGVMFSSRAEVGQKRFKPELLCGINWASSGPGYSWPEVYHLAWLPVFERWVVVASRDTDEVDGYCDRVLGHFADCDEPATHAANVIEQYWSGLRDYDQERFEEVTDTGSISDVDEIADRVWGDCDERDEVEAEEVNDD